ncbi:MAG TPA: DUF1284 domain-containing protein [Nitrospira sp.]|nr:DUF1284 domain-containing protein [Nitrospira sp.]
MNDLPSRTDSGDAGRPLRLRGHTLLCLQGFRGEGYSPGFVRNMADVHRFLNHHPDAWIEVIDSPDSICAACPHQAASGCTLNDDRSEEEMKRQDGVVLERLGLQPGSRLRWREILDRIRRSVRGDDLPALCGTCRWMPLGYCREALDGMGQSGSSGDAA